MENKQYGSIGTHAHPPFHGWIYLWGDCTTYMHVFWDVYSLRLHWYEQRWAKQPFSLENHARVVLYTCSFYAVMYIPNYLPSSLPHPQLFCWKYCTCGPWSETFIAEASVFLSNFLILVWGRGFKCSNGSWSFVVVGRTSALSVLLFLIVAWSWRAEIKQLQLLNRTTVL